MRLLVRYPSEEEEGEWIFEELPLTYSTLAFFCRPYTAEPAFRLDFKRGCWEVTSSRHIGLDRSSLFAACGPSVKRLSEHHSFEVHFKCGETKLWI